jgi:hypothetical protein
LGSRYYLNYLVIENNWFIKWSCQYSYLKINDMKIQEYDQDNGTFFCFCPGCQEYHSLHTGRPNSDGVRLKFNNSMEFPSFLPVNIGRIINSGLNRSKHANDTTWKCVFTIKFGKISFSADSSHELAGQTVDLPDLMPEF